MGLRKQVIEVKKRPLELRSEKAKGKVPGAGKGREKGKVRVCSPGGRVHWVPHPKSLRLESLGEVPGEDNRIFNSFFRCVL